MAAEGDEVVVAFLLVALEAERHGLILGYRVRALRECPHLRIEIWGTQFWGFTLDLGHPPLQAPAFGAASRYAAEYLVVSGTNSMRPFVTMR